MLTSIGRAVVLAVVPVLLLFDALTFWSLAGIILALGVLTLFADSAAQPLLPRLVPRRSLVAANARIGQSETVAGTAGPDAGGALFTLLGAPLLFALEAVLHVVSAVLQARIAGRSVPEPCHVARLDGQSRRRRRGLRSRGARRRVLAAARRAS